MRDRATAVLLNYRREQNVQPIVDLLDSTGLISDFLIWNNNPDRKLQGAGKVKILNASHNFKAFARYAAAFLAPTPIILFQDDDWLFHPEQIAGLFDDLRADPGRIYGFIGANLDGGRYVSTPAYGEVDIVLGQFMLFSKDLLASVYGDMAKLGPFERGDDIAFSLLAGCKHLCRPGKRINLGSQDEHALSRHPDHFARRQEMVDRVLALPGMEARRRDIEPSPRID